MFVDELTITARAGNGGNGVVRWRQEKNKPKGGPAGGNGGKGGDVYIRGVRDLGLLSKYTGTKEFKAMNGEEGRGSSQHGHDGDDCYVDIPVGAVISERGRERTYKIEYEGETHKILLGGKGGLGNEYFKSSTNRTPEQSTQGKKGEAGEFFIELSLVVDVGLVGFPNAGKTTLLNALTNTHARVGSYPFTTLEPHLGELYGFILADIPGLIAGASEGKGLGHKFLRHIRRTNMLLHCVSLEHEHVRDAYETIHTELKKFDPSLLEKNEWVILTKSDLMTKENIDRARADLAGCGGNILVISAENGEGIAELRDALVKEMRTQGAKQPS